MIHAVISLTGGAQKCDLLRDLHLAVIDFSARTGINVKVNSDIADYIEYGPEGEVTEWVIRQHVASM